MVIKGAEKLKNKFRRELKSMPEYKKLAKKNKGIKAVKRGKKETQRRRKELQEFCKSKIEKIKQKLKLVQSREQLQEIQVKINEIKENCAIHDKNWWVKKHLMLVIHEITKIEKLQKRCSKELNEEKCYLCVLYFEIVSLTMI